MVTLWSKELSIVYQHSATKSCTYEYLCIRCKVALSTTRRTVDKSTPTTKAIFNIWFGLYCTYEVENGKKKCLDVCCYKSDRKHFASASSVELDLKSSMFSRSSTISAWFYFHTILAVEPEDYFVPVYCKPWLVNLIGLKGYPSLSLVSSLRNL